MDVENDISNEDDQDSQNVENSGGIETYQDTLRKFT